MATEKSLMDRSSIAKVGTPTDDKPNTLPYDEERVQEPGSFKEFLAMHPRYRSRWWKTLWSESIRRGRWPRLLYIAIGASFILLWIGITIRYAKEEQDFGRHQDLRFRQTDSTKHNGSIGLDGTLKGFDQQARTLTISWSGLWRDFPEMDPVPLANGSFGNWPFPLKIYRDVGTTIHRRVFEDNTTAWRYILNNVSTPSAGVIGLNPYDSFSTDIDFQQTDRNGNVWSKPLVGYPWDKWTGSIVFVSFAPIANTNSSSLELISSARLSDNTLNWRFELDPEPNANCPELEEVIGQAIPGMSNNQTAQQELLNLLEDDFLSQLNFPCYLEINIKATRPPLVKFAVMMALIVNWTSTIFIFVLTCETVILRRGYMLGSTDLFGVVFTSLFSLPAVRSLLPGAPDFGILIDQIGIIPQVIIISICIIIIAVAKLNRIKKEEMKEE